MIDIGAKWREWLGRAPEGMQPYIGLARLDKPVGIWLLLLPGWWAIVLASGGVFSMSLRDWWIFILFGVGAVVMRAAGCVVNDIWDRELDRQVERTKDRPLASGAVNVTQAAIFLAALAGIGLLILIQMNLMTIILGVMTLPLIVAYPLMKRFTWWPQAFLGITFNFGALMGWSAVTGVPEFTALLLYIAGICWTLGYDTVYAQQDIEDDAMAGIKSSALRLGPDSKKFVAGCYASTWLCLAAAGMAGASGSLSFLWLLPAMFHFGWQIFAWKTDDAASSLKIFKSNRDLGLLVLAAFAIS